MRTIQANVALLVALALSFAAHAFDLQGHRGARGLAPENTLPAFERALALGVTTLELDIAITSDGVLVIHHDSTLNPDTTRDSTGRFLERRGPPIRSLSWAELQTYDVGRLKPGSDYGKRYPEQQPVDGTRIPRLSDLFDLVKRLGDDKVRFDIETKLTPTKPEETVAPEPFARALVAEIRKAGMAARSQIQSFDWRTLQVVQAIAPEIPTVYLTAQQSWLDNIGATQPEGSIWTAGFQYKEHGSVPKMVKAAGGSYWSAYFGDLDPQKIKEAQSLGLRVVVWTVNDPAVMSRMLDWGVDGLITDRPDLARKVLEARGVRWR
ncbi:MAG TPA: glycerophosphodiester phosphodiesterase [Burkholderiales bacterium]|jgi:glycerophosphoryl diester phosphodiesterase|nr:glycerophosphodiester phosphodiesterase [Burkholderiales bacterium]